VKKKEVKLYSAMFPFYGLLLADFSNFGWMMLVNLAICALVSFLVLRLNKTQDWKKLTVQVTGRAFATGLLADLAAMIFRFGPLLAEMLLRVCGAKAAAAYLAKYWSDFTWYHIWMTDWNKIGLPWTIASILVGGIAAFLLNYFVMLKRIVPDKKRRRTLSIFLAIFSAPYSWTNPMW